MGMPAPKSLDQRGSKASFCNQPQLERGDRLNHLHLVRRIIPEALKSGLVDHQLLTTYIQQSGIYPMQGEWLSSG